ncbi:MAG: hypothetical protein QF473_05645, partial [Planctomycetota bacterium]|nr:hypothetical protein [Planctomycetota bacterium]
FTWTRTDEEREDKWGKKQKLSFECGSVSCKRDSMDCRNGLPAGEQDWDARQRPRSGVVKHRRVKRCSSGVWLVVCGFFS